MVVRNTQWIKVKEDKLRWWLRPICWLFYKKKHRLEITTLYGVKIQRCKWCRKYFWNKKVIKARDKLDECFFKGEVGQMFGVKLKCLNFTENRSQKK